MKRAIYINISILISVIIIFYFFTQELYEKSIEEYNKYDYVRFDESCSFKVKSFEYSLGWTKIISTKNDSLLFSIVGLDDELNVGDSLSKKMNSNILNIIKKQEAIRLKIDYNRKLDSKVNLD